MIRYEENPALQAADVANVFQRSGIRRPFQELERIQRMIEGADIILSAWDGERMVGIARAITDYSYCCYLSDLAVDQAYQKNGVGKELVRRLREKLSEEVALILLAAPEAVDYYPKIGFEHNDRCFMIPRLR
jgi:GNAT superfamily N-acetyltransferase